MRRGHAPGCCAAANSDEDAYSFDVSDEGLDASYQAQRDAYERIFKRLGLEYVIGDDSGAMGGSKGEEFLLPIAIGEDTFVRSSGGFVANVEAFATPVPDALSADEIAPAALVFDSPNTPTIETLVAHTNAVLPRELAAVDGLNTLKNVVLAVTPISKVSTRVSARSSSSASPATARQT